MHLGDLQRLVAREHEQIKYLRKLRTPLFGKRAEASRAQRGHEVLPDGRLRSLQTVESAGASARPCSPAPVVTTRLANE